jgi:hypothetical protein
MWSGAVESGLLAGIKRDLLAPELSDEVRRYVRQGVRAKGRGAAPVNRLAEVEKEITNLTDAIATGALRASPAIAERLMQAEAELARLKVTAAQAATAPNVERMIPQVAGGSANNVVAGAGFDLCTARALHLDIVEASLCHVPNPG